MPDGTVVALYSGNMGAKQALEVLANLGTGRGISVLQMVNAFAPYSGQSVPYQAVARRPGDIASYFPDPAHARQVLGWQARRGLQQMCEDVWRWQSGHPGG